MSAKRLTKLTFRKVTILLHLERGLSYKQIAALLGIHANTVRHHVNEVAEALPCHGKLPPRDCVLLWCDRLLEWNPDVVADVRARETNAA